MNDRDYMQIALDYAENNAVGNQGQVGAILVKDGLVVASGASNDDLGLHAEQVVIDSSDEPEGSTLFVTVQPSLYRTDDLIQSDSELIAEAGIARVVVGIPNEKYSLQESQEFFVKHDVEFEILADKNLGQKCLDLFIKTGASQVPRIFIFVLALTNLVK